MESEKESLKQNVIDFEPHHALFVPSNDPLLFYKAISQKGAEALKDNGMLFVEVNEQLANDVATLFKKSGYHNEQIISDLSNKPRIVTAIK
jgi:release factor glutamine methyltransferase